MRGGLISVAVVSYVFVDVGRESTHAMIGSLDCVAHVWTILVHMQINVEKLGMGKGTSSHSHRTGVYARPCAVVVIRTSQALEVMADARALYDATTPPPPRATRSCPNMFISSPSSSSCPQPPCPPSSPLSRRPRQPSQAAQPPSRRALPAPPRRRPSHALSCPCSAPACSPRRPW